jgi:tetratricopeptide (TPR) repeat protein
MKINLLYLLLVLFVASSFAQSDIEKGVLRGLDYCYNFKWQKAEDEFQKLSDKYPDDMRGYHYRSTISLWYYLSSKSDNDYQNFVKYSDIALDKGAKQLDSQPNNEIILYTLGTAYSSRAIVFAKAENYINAAWASNKSEKYLNEALQINPKRIDAYLGLGLYNFAVGQIPSAFKWALNLAGIKGNKELGIQYIKKTSNEGYFSKTEATYYLSQIYSESINNYEAAAVCLKSLLKKYPDNLLFNYSMGVVEIKRKNLSSAEKIISKLLKTKEINFAELINFSNFLMGDICFKENNFETAKDYYLLFLNSSDHKDYKGIASYRLGICLELIGDRNSAVKYYNQSNKGNTDLEDDIFAKRKGEIFAKRSIASTEIDVIKAANIIEQGHFKEAIQSFSASFTLIKTERLKAEVNYYISTAYFFMGEYDEAVKYGNICRSFNSSEESWIKPFNCYYLAQSLLKLNKKDEALKMIDEADDCTDYDYQNKLKNLISGLKMQL